MTAANPAATGLQAALNQLSVHKLEFGDENRLEDVSDSVEPSSNGLLTLTHRYS